MRISQPGNEAKMWPELQHDCFWVLHFFSVQFPDFLILIFPQAGVEARVCPENYLIMAEAGERLAFSLGCGKDKDKEKTKANTKTN